MPRIVARGFKKEDLKNKNFDNVWLILQSC